MIPKKKLRPFAWRWVVHGVCSLGAVAVHQMGLPPIQQPGLTFINGNGNLSEANVKL